MPRTKKRMVPSEDGKKPEQEATLSTSSPQEPVANHNIFNSDGELVVDVFETDADFVVLATIAGVAIKDLDISVEKDMMIIKGDRKHPHHEYEKKFFFQECYFGPFSRKIVLPENLHTQKALAEMDKGVLTVKIPKHEEPEKTDVKTV